MIFNSEHPVRESLAKKEVGVSTQGDIVKVEAV